MARVSNPSPILRAPGDTEMATIRDDARLAALRKLGLLDSGPDETIDSFTRLATEVLGVPISLVSLLDADRQFFLSERGLGGAAARARETPLSHSICKYVVAGGEPVVVDDALADPVIRDNLAVSELGVGAYAGMPLVLADGTSIGALCAIDTGPRRWSKRELALLGDLATALNSILDLRSTMARQNLHDTLTGLPNRELLVASCNCLIERLGADDGVAVVCAGIDHFNLVNQAFGADQADRVLCAVAERLGSVTDGSEIFGRLRGDVFTLITPGVDSEEKAFAAGQRFHEALAEKPLVYEGEPLSVRVTVGVATGGRGTSGADLISEAANAMREAKRQQGRVRVAGDDWTQTAAVQLRTREALHGALDRGEISAVFQPVVEIDGGAVVSFEALCRWSHPELGAVSPEDFIPLAELTGDIVPLGRWMFEQAANLVTEAREERDFDLVVGVNASPLQLEEPDFAEVAREICELRGIEGRSLGIEITEGGLLETGPVQVENLARLKELGVHIVLDDFGTGYSALGYLRDFSIGIIKIDRSFVERLTGDRHAAALIQAIIAMCRGMDMEIVAEGIETEEQARVLSLLGCRYGQGFHFGRPMAPDAALDLLPRGS